MTVLLGHYRRCKGDTKQECVDVSSEGTEQSLEHCVTESLRENWDKRNRFLSRSRLDFLSSSEFRRVALADARFASSPRTPEAIIERLHDGDFKRRIDAAHVRYLVVLDGQTNSGEAQLDGGGAMGFLAIGAGSKSSSTITATVVDMHNGFQAGVATAESSGQNSAGVAGYVIPFVPVFWIGSTETEACNELGKTLGQRFFLLPGAVQVPQ